MSYTKEVIVTDDWTEVAREVKNVAIQFDNQGRIRVHVGTDTLPDAEAPGILVAKSIANEPSTFAVGALPSDAVVYARSVSSDSSVDLTVLAY